MILPQSFYNRSVLKVAQDLLGCFLVILPKGKSPTTNGAHANKVILPKGKITRYKIVETEAYNGPSDSASHASKGQTERNKVMFGEPGIIYVYFTYGIHYMLNIVTGAKNYPAAVLIRAIEPADPNYQLPITNYQYNGPARLTKSLQINKSFNGLPIYEKKYGLWIESRKEIIKPGQIKKSTRVGVDYAKEYKNKKWRFYIKNNKFISKK